MPERQSLIRSFRSFLGRSAREVALWKAARQKRSGPGVAFFPCYNRSGSSLLRVYNIAEQLDQFGWTTFVCPPHLSQSQRSRLMRWFKPEISVVQTCRHPLNRASNFAGTPYVFELDDADFVDDALAQPMADIAQGAKGVLCGSRFIKRWANGFNPDASVVWTGTPVTGGPWPDHQDRAAIITWAQSEPTGYAREFAFITDVLCEVRQTSGPFTLRLYGWVGPKEHPLLDRLTDAGIELDIREFLPYPEYLSSLREVAIGLSPVIAQAEFSKGKSFGKILGYLDAKVPVICSDEVDHSLFFDSKTGVVSNDHDVWVRSIQELLADAPKRQSMADHAYTYLQKRLSVKVAAQHVDAALRTWLKMPAHNETLA